MCMNKKFLAGILVFSVALLSAACKKTGQDVSPSDTSSTLSKGQWKITYFYDSGDETYKFNGYAFTFNGDGTLNAVKGSATVSGTWSTGTDDSQTKLDLSFGNTEPFEELNDDWHVTELSASKIVTEDVSSGNDDTDYLTFEKI